MKVTRHADPAAFSRLAQPLLLQNEAMHCVALGIIDILTRNPERFGQGFYLFAVEDGTRLEGVAWMTPPYPLGLSLMSRKAVEALVEVSGSLADPPSAVYGPRPTVDEFKARWLVKTGSSVKTAVEQRIYRLERVVQPRAVPGMLQVATPADVDWLSAWSMAFVKDCGLQDPPEAVRHNLVAGLSEGSRVYWEVSGQPVAMAASGGKTPSGVRVSWVYTPSELRGRGYASALVAALSQRLLDEGRRFCFLNTDLSNSTSNAIYQRIGYEPVCDSAHYTFV